jgi:hypothetical protein
VWGRGAGGRKGVVAVAPTLFLRVSLAGKIRGQFIPDCVRRVAYEDFRNRTAMILRDEFPL